MQLLYLQVIEMELEEVERLLAKQKVVGSNPIVRSIISSIVSHHKMEKARYPSG